MSKSKSNGLLEYYKEMKKIKEYERNMTGTVILSMIVLIGSFLFVYRIFSVIFKDCSWAILNNYFAPPVQFIMYSMMIATDPTEHIDILCRIGRIVVPTLSFAYCAYMMYMSYVHSSPFEFAFYVFLAIVEMTMLLDEKKFGVSLFRPFLRRPESELEAERHAVARKFKFHEAKPIDE